MMLQIYGIKNNPTELQRRNSSGIFSQSQKLQLVLSLKSVNLSALYFNSAIDPT
jgi:hypothetical protein